MANIDVSNTSSGSTKWEWKRVKIQGSTRRGQRPLAGTTPLSLRRRDRYKPITVTLTYRGGPEASWLVTFRGIKWRFPGVTALHDVMRTVNNDWDL